MRKVFAKRVHPGISKFIDRLIIRGATAAQPKAGTFPRALEQARDLYQQPDLFDRHVPVPVELKWSSATEFAFTSGISSEWPQNNMVHGKLFKCGEDWRCKPAVVLIHGWNDELGYAFRHPYMAKKFLKQGLNVAMLELPYHMRRRPRGNGAVNDFLSENLFCTIQAAQQGVLDVRMLLAWLESQGCPQLGLVGVSLGGWITGLVVCHDERVDVAVMNIPVVRMDRVVTELEFCEPIRRSLGDSALDFERFNLRSHTPKLQRENILIIEAVDDLFAARDAIEELWQTWGQPDIWRIRHGHISSLFSLALMRRTVDWVAEKVKSSHRAPERQR